jgi:hypothetical protein
MTTIEYVDVLVPPMFEPSGEVKPVGRAVADGNWLGAINLWIVRPGPALIYQERPPGGWAPGKLDGSVAGYYRAGEFGLDGLREAEEELGRKYSIGDVTAIGRRLNVGVDSLGRERRVVVSIFMTYDDIPISNFVLDPKEVPAIYEIPVRDLAACFQRPGDRFVARGVDCNRHPVERHVLADDFSYMWDGYHAKIADFARRYASGERSLQY